jgi:hypothetical protein
MRGGLLLEGLARNGELVLAVLPVADPKADESTLRWASERASPGQTIRTGSAAHRA